MTSISCNYTDQEIPVNQDLNLVGCARRPSAALGLILTSAGWQQQVVVVVAPKKAYFALAFAATNLGNQFDAILLHHVNFKLAIPPGAHDAAF